MNNAVIILGAGPEQIDAYKFCKKKKILIVGVDKRSESYGLKLSNYIINSSIYDFETINKKIKRFKNIKIIGLIAIGVDCPRTVFEISKTYGLKNLSKNVYQKIGTKLSLYKSLKPLKVSPKFKKISNFSEIKNFIKKENFPVIIKPSADRGSRNVYLIKNNKHLKDLIVKKKKLIFTNNFLIQKYIYGTQYSVECLVLSNNKFLRTISERNYKTFKHLRPNVIEDGGTVNPNLNPYLEKKFDKIVEKLLRYLKIPSGPFKLDLILNNGKIYVLEVAIRFGGGCVASKISKHISGVNFLDKYIDMIIKNKKKFPQRNFVTKKCVVMRFIIAKRKGTIKKIGINIPLHLKKHLLFLSFNKKKGDYVKPPESHADRLCMIVSIFSKKTNAEITADKITNCIKFEINSKLNN